MIEYRRRCQPLLWHRLWEGAPIVDAVPGGIVFVCELFDPPGVVGRILLQKMIRQLVEGRDCSLASAQVLEERL